MSDTQQRQYEDLSQEELVRLVKRSQFVREQQNQRMIGILSENLELLAIIQELQADLAAARADSNGEVPHPEVLTDVTS
jgi:transcription elongation GreA/GreB family factor